MVAAKGGTQNHEGNCIESGLHCIASFPPFSRWRPFHSLKWFPPQSTSISSRPLSRPPLPAKTYSREEENVIFVPDPHYHRRRARPGRAHLLVKGKARAGWLVIDLLTSLFSLFPLPCDSRLRLPFLGLGNSSVPSMPSLPFANGQDVTKLLRYERGTRKSWCAHQGLDADVSSDRDVPSLVQKQP